MRTERLTSLIRSAVAVVAVGVFLCGASSTYATDECVATCKDAATQQTSAVDATACGVECNDFCATHGLVLSCFFKGENVKGNCDVVCKADEANDHIVLAGTQATEAFCTGWCNDFCEEHDGVVSCDFKGDLVKTDIPTVSEWGLVVMGLLVLAAGGWVLRRRGSVAPPTA